MIKRFLWIGLSLCLILTGCAKDAPTGTTTGDSFFEPWVRPTLEGVSTEDWYEVPAYSGSPLIAPDENREVYLSLANQDCDFYPDLMYRGVNLYIVSKQPIDPAKITVEIPAKSGYSVQVFDYSNDCHGIAYKDVSNLGIKDYQYLSLRGIDWRQIAQARSDASEAGAIFNDTTLESSFRMSVYDTFMEPYDTLWASYQEAYQAAPADELPMFYAYNVIINFQDFTDETVDHLTVNLAGKSYPLSFGQWRLHSQMPDGLTGESPEGIQKLVDCVMGISDSAYRGGYVQLPNALEFNATKDLTLTGIKGEQTSVELLGAKVEYLSGSDSGMNFFWDGRQPLDIPAGTHVSITPYVYDQRFAAYEVCCTMLLKMDYEITGKELSLTIPCLMARHNDFWDTYLLALRGYDIGEYYTCFASRIGDFVADMPESWKR